MGLGRLGCLNIPKDRHKRVRSCQVARADVALHRLVPEVEADHVVEIVQSQRHLHGCTDVMRLQVILNRNAIDLQPGREIVSAQNKVSMVMTA